MNALAVESPPAHAGCHHQPQRRRCAVVRSVHLIHCFALNKLQFVLDFLLLLLLLLLLLHTLQSIVSNKTLSPLLLNFSPSSAHLVDLDRTVDLDHKLLIPEGKKTQKIMKIKKISLAHERTPALLPSGSPPHSPLTRPRSSPLRLRWHISCSARAPPTHSNTHTHKRTHARTRARTHTNTHLEGSEEANEAGKHPHCIAEDGEVPEIDRRRKSIVVGGRVCARKVVVCAIAPHVACS